MPYLNCWVHGCTPVKPQTLNRLQAIGRVVIQFSGLGKKGLWRKQAPQTRELESQTHKITSNQIP